MRKIFIAIPTTGTIVDSLPHVLRRIEKHYKGEVQFVYPESCVRRVFHDFARNEFVEDFLKSDADVMWFIDSDVTPPDHILDLVTKQWDEWKCAGGYYPVLLDARANGDLALVMVVYKANETKTSLVICPKVPQTGQERVAGLGTGCMFIKREVFSLLEKPYFEFKYENANRNISEGEDLGFCRKLMLKGVDFLVDYSMVCKHRKTVDLLDLNNYAIQYAHDSVLAYDRSIRPQVEAAIKAAFQTGKTSQRSLLITPNSPTLWPK